MQFSQKAITMAAFAGAVLMSLLLSFLASLVIESRSGDAVTSALLENGMTWTTVETDGLIVRLRGIAPNEADRFRSMGIARGVIDAARVRDRMTVEPARLLEAPRFSVEMLRNDDGIQLIGLVPASDDEATSEAAIAAAAAAINPDVAVDDMLETAKYAAPLGWQEAVDFGLSALAVLPRSKISVSANRVAITAISSSEAERKSLEQDLKSRAPEGLDLVLDISAPRPVLTPFTLRFLLDDKGGRFDACSADTERSKARILAAAEKAGVAEGASCTIGLGVPTPQWAEAVEAGISAIAALGAGTISFSDADVTLLAAENTSQATYDRVIGELQTALPDVFSLNATLPKSATALEQGPAEFTASMSPEGKVELRGRLTDATLRDAVDAYARASLGTQDVYTATRLDPELPDGWPVRVLAGLEAMAELESANLLVRADTVELSGISGSQQAKARIAQILSAKLGQGKTYKVDVTYEESLDPTAAIPTPDQCKSRIEAALASQKISFEPGSSDISAAARPTIEALVTVLRDCPNMRVEIAGHTDSQGSEDGNRKLSQSRAEAVLLALQGRRLAVDGFTATGYGETKPIADNADEAGREANRRIEFTFLDLPGNSSAAVQPGEGGVAATPATPAQSDNGPSYAPTENKLRPKRRAQNG